ncbi:hypothetical protein MMC26_003927 [Xylographa opegraphella]|nr:hypothetical protein [Xylographa opegraphella]
MLAYYPRRQQASPSSSLTTLDQLYHGLPSPPHTRSLPLSSSSQVVYETSIALDTSHPSGIDCYHNYSLTSPHYFMPTTPSHNPPIRVHQSTSSPGEALFSPSLPADDGNQPTASWLQYANYGHLTSEPGRQSHHKRHSSGSSIASVGPASPYTPSTSYPRIHDSELTSYPSPAYDTFDNHHGVGSSYPKPLPSAPVQTFSESFHLSQYQDYYSSPADNAQLHLAAMRHAIMAQQESEMGDATSAPRSVYAGGDFEDGFKIPSTNMPKLDRTISDIYQDELYNPIMAATPPITQSHPTSSQGNLLSPHRDVFTERLQAANNSHIARSASPTTSISRERSPFRQGSEYAAEQYSQANTPVARIGSAARMREQRKAEADADAYQQHQPASTAPESPRTISPKEAMLDYTETEEDSKLALFPRERNRVSGINQGVQFTNLKPVKQESIQSDTGELSTQQSFLSMATTRRESSSNYSSTSGLGQSRPKTSNTSPSSIQVPQQYPFISQARRQNSSMGSMSEQPEFPASLTSMDSTRSEGALKSSQEQSEPSAEIQRPSRTTADSGTYTCTYHGCTQRFETPAKLQKHKRDGHRQATPQNGAHSPNSGSGSSAAALLASRNSQAGPHKCERINPSTGKPCNSIFSRPYDLTRHEDTIHNARKQKVRCQFCTEEKTFSRNDALTRHMRVVHPEVDFPGKTKRKGVN